MKPRHEANLRQIPLTTLDGRATSLAEHADKVVLVVNVASRCGLTPQYAALEDLQRTYGPRGLQVIGFPCNSFAGQEPGSAETIAEYCSTTYGVTFPLMEKTKVNGHRSHPLYAHLRSFPDASGHAGRVRWNFEKFLIMPDDSVERFRPQTVPDAPEVLAAIERGLAMVDARRTTSDVVGQDGPSTRGESR